MKKIKPGTQVWIVKENEAVRCTVEAREPHRKYRLLCCGSWRAWRLGSGIYLKKSDALKKISDVRLKDFMRAKRAWTKEEQAFFKQLLKEKGKP